MAAYNCPWCGNHYTTDYDIHQHIEEWHTEGSPFAVTQSCAVSQPASSSHSQRENDEEQLETVECPRFGCGERICLDGIAQHLAVHEASDDSTSRIEPELSASIIRKRATLSKAGRSSKPRSNDTGPSVLSFLSGKSGSKQRHLLKQRRDHARLGTKELGPYAFEKAMPSSVRRILEDAAMPVVENQISRSGRLVRHSFYPNETMGLIPVLADLCTLDRSTTTYLCHNETKHIHRIRCDGNFCGFWNIQMMMTYVLAKQNPKRGLPTVLQIQDIIEKAWSDGICPNGRDETGGIFNTRKWIGTHEALAFYRQLDISVSASSFATSDEQPAYAALLDFVEVYFLAGLSSNLETRNDLACVMTTLPPIYLQRAGHSMTIIGLARRDDGERSLLIFDPSRDTLPAMSRILSGRSVHVLPDTLLAPYRWSEKRLADWNEYETLIIDDSQPLPDMQPK